MENRIRKALGGGDTVPVSGGGGGGGVVQSGQASTQDVKAASKNVDTPSMFTGPEGKKHEVGMRETVARDAADAQKEGTGTGTGTTTRPFPPISSSPSTSHAEKELGGK
jgi:hypothetical protein